MNFLELLNEGKQILQQEPRLIYPMFVLVLLVWQGNKIVQFWIDKEYPLDLKELPPRWRKQLIVEHQRIVLLVFVLTLSVGCWISEILFKP